jgi:hypothetical protein
MVLGLEDAGATSIGLVAQFQGLLLEDMPDQEIVPLLISNP